MRKSRTLPPLGALGRLIACTVLLLSACQAKDHDHETDEPKTEAHTDEIVLTHDKAQAAGVAVEAVSPGPFSDVVAVSGRIQEASGRETTVTATTAGIVRLTRPITEGMSVARGSSLMVISAHDLSAVDPVEATRTAFETARAEYDRVKRLAQDKLATQQELNTARANYENARLAREAVMRHHTAQGRIVSAPAAGYIKTCLVKDGDYVNLGQPLASITQDRELQLRADVPERYYSQLGRITSAIFVTPYDNRTYDIREIGGRLIATGRAAGPASAYIPVTFSFKNTGRVVPGSFVEVYLQTGRREGIISVPNGALTEEQGLYFVYIQTGPDTYRRQEVTTGATDGRRTEIVSGLKPGDKVVAQGAIQIRLAAASTVIPAHTHSH